jgi:hypothetical protein
MVIDQGKQAVNSALHIRIRHCALIDPAPAVSNIPPIARSFRRFMIVLNSKGGLS